MSQASQKTFGGKDIGDCGWRVTDVDIERTDTGYAYTVTIQGKKSDLKALCAAYYTTEEGGTVTPHARGAYAVGATLPDAMELGIGGGTITKTKLSTQRAGLAKLVVTASKDGDRTDDGSSSQGGGESAQNYHEELDWTTATRPLAEFSSTTADFTSMSAADWAQIGRWESLKGKTEYAGRYGAFQAPTSNACKKDSGPAAGDDGDWEQAFTSTPLLYVQLVAKGVTEFYAQVPVYRKTSQSNLNQANAISKCGQRDDSGVPQKFRILANAWLKTADRWTRDSKNGSWNHSEEWSGFDSLDATLYPTGASS